MKTTTPPPLPAGVGSTLMYRCEGPIQSGVCFKLRLAYRDETREPAVAGQFEHEWLVSRQDFDEAERLERSDQALLNRREVEEREFLRIVESILRRDGVCLERVDHEWVMRRAGP